MKNSPEDAPRARQVRTWGAGQAWGMEAVGEHVLSVDATALRIEPIAAVQE